MGTTGVGKARSHRLLLRIHLAASSADCVGCGPANDLPGLGIILRGPVIVFFGIQRYTPSVRGVFFRQARFDNARWDVCPDSYTRDQLFCDLGVGRRVRRCMLLSLAHDLRSTESSKKVESRV